MFGKKKKTAGRKVAGNFITYNGYVEELKLFKNADGKWFRFYKADIQKFNPDEVRKLFPVSGVRIQMVIDKENLFVLAGVKADIPEEADRQLTHYDDLESLTALEPAEWFQCLAKRLTGEEFVGFPDPKKERKKKAIDRVMPYNVQIEQKSMAYSGKKVRTILLIGYPSEIYSAFTTELLKLPGSITVSLHATYADPDLCLEGLKYSEEIRLVRKETMRQFLTEIKQSGESIYQTAFYISIEGEGDETDETFEKVKKLCKKFLTGYSELDFQQKEGFVSTLPLLQNRVDYNTVLTSENLLGLCPWSELKDRQTGPVYGEDSILGTVQYKRFSAEKPENGCVLSSQYENISEIVKMELVDLIKKGITVHVLMSGEYPERVEDICDAIGPTGTGKSYTLDLTDASPQLYKNMVIYWAKNACSTNGRITRQREELIRNAADMEPSHDFLERFIGNVTDTSLRSALNVRPFPKTVFAKQYIGVNESDILAVNGTPLERTLAYALLMEQCRGIVYSLNTELISVNAGLFTPDAGTVYTYSAVNLDTFYQSKEFNNLIPTVEFWLIGEHKIPHKLALMAALGEAGMFLSKKEQAWISEPANGTVMITALASYMLVNKKRDHS